MWSSSKIILVAATTLIVGIYGISMKKAESAGVETALKHVKRIQQEKVEDAAVRTALSAYVANNGNSSKKVITAQKGLNGSTYTYEIVKYPAHGAVSVTVVTDGVPKVITARLEKNPAGVPNGGRKIQRGEYQITKRYVAK